MHETKHLSAAPVTEFYWISCSYGSVGVSVAYFMLLAYCSRGDSKLKFVLPYIWSNSLIRLLTFIGHVVSYLKCVFCVIVPWLLTYWSPFGPLIFVFDNTQPKWARESEKAPLLSPWSYGMTMALSPEVNLLLNLHQTKGVFIWHALGIQAVWCILKSFSCISFLLFLIFNE